MKKLIYYIITILALGFTSCDQEDYTETVYSFSISNDSSTDSLWVKYKVASDMAGAPCVLPDGEACLDKGSMFLTTKAVDYGKSTFYEEVQITKSVDGLNHPKVGSDSDLKELIQTLEVYTINGTDTQLAIPSAYFKKLNNWHYSYADRDKKTNIEQHSHGYRIFITDDMLKQ